MALRSNLLFGPFYDISMKSFHFDFSPFHPPYYLYYSAVLTDCQVVSFNKDFVKMLQRFTLFV